MSSSSSSNSSKRMNQWKLLAFFTACQHTRLLAATYLYTACSLQCLLVAKFQRHDITSLFPFRHHVLILAGDDSLQTDPPNGVTSRHQTPTCYLYTTCLLWSFLCAARARSLSHSRNTWPLGSTTLPCTPYLDPKLLCASAFTLATTTRFIRRGSVCSQCKEKYMYISAEEHCVRGTWSQL